MEPVNNDRTEQKKPSEQWKQQLTHHNFLLTSTKKVITMMSSNNNNKTVVSSLVTTAAVAIATATAVWWMHRRRHERTKWMDKQRLLVVTKDTLPSIFEDFADTKLGLESTISEANKKRTQVYYERARDAHVYDLCPGVRSYPRLRNRREATIKRIMRYYNNNNSENGQPRKSHRTVICMCDATTAQLLDTARSEILAPLDYSTDIATEHVWIPQQCIIPPQHMHVTVAILWWWHTMRDENRDLSKMLVGRLRQALVSEFHYAFQIELERIVLLGGCALVALWRCIGQRQIKNVVICNTNTNSHHHHDGSNSNNNSGNNNSSTTTTNFTIFDRHGEQVDPFVKLRRDIVRFITDPDPNIKLEPLTYQHLKAQQEQQQEMMERNEGGGGGGCLHKEQKDPEQQIPAPTTPAPPRRPFERSDSIEIKTPGLGESQDGFIHTTLARLPLDCLSMTDTELAPIHRLCREASATYCGHRMVISSFRVIETIGAGGESNPCVNPIFDETIHAPVRVEVVPTSGMMEQADLHATRKDKVDQHATVGGMRHRTVLSRGDVNLAELFAEPPPQPQLPCAAAAASKSSA